MMKQKHPQRRKLLTRLLIGVVSLSLAAILYACYPGESLSVTETDTVTTFRQKDADFTSKTSYAMPDSVLHIDRDGEVADDPDRTYDQTIVNAIARNMQAMGYQKEDDPDQANVHVLPLVTTTDWVGGTCYPSWSCWYYCYPGWCYPVAYTYTTGTILILMMDPQQAGGTEQVTPLWLAGVNGLLTGGVNTQRINSGVDQAFTQSPYLGEGK